MTFIQIFNVDNLQKSSQTNNCIVLDIDNTLVSTFSSDESRKFDPVKSIKDLGILTKPELLPLRSRFYRVSIEDYQRPGEGSYVEMWGIMRPHLKEFLTFCFSYFQIVAVWSAGMRKYVENMVDILFRDLPKPHVIFTRDDIIDQKNMVKPIAGMIESNPVLMKYMSLSNTFALDDNPLTFSNNVNNGVLIPRYDPSLTIDSLAKDDPALLQFKYWLARPNVSQSRDITTLEKSDIFKISVDDYIRSMK